MAAQEVLLEEGAPINALDMNKQSALHAAVFLLMDDMVEASDSRLRHLPNGVFPAIKRSFCWMILSNLRRVVSNLVCSDPHETIANAQRYRNSRSLFAQTLNLDKRSEPVGVRVVLKRAVRMTASFSPWRERHRLKSLRSWNKLVLPGPEFRCFLWRKTYCCSLNI